MLSLIVADMLVARFPNEHEGDISRRHADLVRMETLNRVSRNLELGRHVQMSRGEEQSGGRENSALLSDVCEAVIAALYQDGGLDVARAFIEKHWAPLIEENLLPPKDAKTTLQEWAQGEGHPLPLYTETGRDGPDHDLFHRGSRRNGLEPASGRGGSKRLAEQAAQLHFSNMLGWTMTEATSRCGFIAILGAPNVGKSTLSTSLSAEGLHRQSESSNYADPNSRHLFARRCSTHLYRPPGIFVPRRR